MTDDLAAAHRTWVGWGGVLGALVGLAAGAFIDWYFTRGPGSATSDAGEAHGLIVLLLGFPFSMLAESRVGFVLSLGANGALLGALAGVFLTRLLRPDPTDAS